jgi:hypothetical protein
VRPPGTIDDLLSDAAARQLPASERLITDWISLGLLAHPQRQPLGRGKGSDKALFSSAQRELFNVLIDQRHRTLNGKPTASRVATLANVPVWLWLQFTEGIPLEQIRKAMTTFRDAYYRVSQHRASYSARLLLEQIAHPDAKPKDKKHFLKVISLGATSGEFRRGEFLDAARRVIDPHKSGIVISPHAAVIEDTATAIEARYAAVPLLVDDRLTDTDYERARWIYRQSWNDYTHVNTAQPTATLEDLYKQLPRSTLEQRVNEACNDLLTLLGMGVLYARDHRPDRPTQCLP